jgi:hypothetical protein
MNSGKRLSVIGALTLTAMVFLWWLLRNEETPSPLAGAPPAAVVQQEPPPPEKPFAPVHSGEDQSVEIFNMIYGWVRQQGTREKIVGATVKALGSAGQESEIQTNEKGEFVFNDLTDDVYRLDFSADGHVDGYRDDVRLGTGMNVTLFKTDLLTGQVLDAATGDPIPKFDVSGFTTQQDGRTNPFSTNSFSNKDGLFSIPAVHLFGSAAMLSISAPGFLEKRVETEPFLPTDSPFPLSVYIKKGGVIEGTVFDSNHEPVNNAQVDLNPVDYGRYQLIDSSFDLSAIPHHRKTRIDDQLRQSYLRVNRSYREVSTDASGHYRFDTLTPREYSVAVAEKNYWESQGQITLIDNETRRMDFTLKSGEPLVGQITIDGIPQQKLKVRAVLDHAEKLSGYDYTDENGWYEIPGITEGLLELSFRIDLEDGFHEVKTYTQIDEHSSLQTDVHYRTGKFVLRGTVYEDDDTLLQYGRIIMTRNDGDQNVTYECSPNDGTFEFSGLASGRYFIQVFGSENHPPITQSIFLGADENREIEFRFKTPTDLTVNLIPIQGFRVLVWYAALMHPYVHDLKALNVLETDAVELVQVAGDVATISNLQPGEYRLLTLYFTRTDELKIISNSNITLAPDGANEFDITLQR